MTMDPLDSQQSSAPLPDRSAAIPPVDSDPNLNEAIIPGADRNIACLEQVLARLEPEQNNVYVHHDFRVGSPSEECMMTFRREENGNYTVWNGKPSRNGTLALSEDVLVQVQHPVLLKEDQAFYLGTDKAQNFNRPLLIPSNLVRIPADTASLVPDLLEKSIQQLAEGDRLIIGRGIQKERVLADNGMLLPGTFTRTVSRQHCTIIRQEDALHPDGRRQKIFQLLDGVPGEQQLFSETAGGVMREFVREIQLPPGARIRVGSPTGPVIEIPDPLQGFDASQAIKGVLSLEQSISEYADRIGAGEVSMQSISFRRQADLSSRNLNVTPQQAQLLGIHLHEGLQLIRDGSYEKAIKHFSQEQVLATCGFTLTDGNYFSRSVPTITGNDVYDLLQRIASRSWFYNNKLEVSPSFGSIQKTAGELTPREQEHLREFQRESSLLYAEEWAHAFQSAMGILVSQKGELIKHLPARPLSDPHEHDVAELFSEQRIPLSKMFMDRHDRDRVHAMLKNYSTEAERSEIRSALALADAGEIVIVGRDPEHYNQRAWDAGADIHFVRFSVDTNSLRPTQAAIRSIYMERQIAPAHARISPNGDGTYSVEPLSNNPQHKLFMKDTHNIWRAVEYREDLPSGTDIRLGTSFEFRLP